jgi:putative transposase
MLLARFGVSQRRACRTVGIHRSTQRLAPPSVTAEEAELRAWLRTLLASHDVVGFGVS